MLQRYNVGNTAHFVRLEMSMIWDKTVSVISDHALEDEESSTRLALRFQASIK
jgi:hypothetical protein